MRFFFFPCLSALLFSLLLLHFSHASPPISAQWLLRNGSVSYEIAHLGPHGASLESGAIRLHCNASWLCTKAARGCANDAWMVAHGGERKRDGADAIGRYNASSVSVGDGRPVHFIFSASSEP